MALCRDLIVAYDTISKVTEEQQICILSHPILWFNLSHISKLSTRDDHFSNFTSSQIIHSTATVATTIRPHHCCLEVCRHKKPPPRLQFKEQLQHTLKYTWKPTTSTGNPPVVAATWARIQNITLTYDDVKYIKYSRVDVGNPPEQKKTF